MMTASPSVPYRAVTWQGFPGLKGHELTVEKVGKHIERGRQAEKEEKETEKEDAKK